MTTVVVEIFSADTRTRCPLPLFSEAVSAGFPSPAEGYVEQLLDLNQHLIRNPAATFFVRVDGFSMREAGIFPRDLLIVDRSLEAQDGNVVIAIVDGQFLCKRYERKGTKLRLVTENSDHPPVVVSPDSDVVIWGVATYVIHSLR